MAKILSQDYQNVRKMYSDAQELNKRAGEAIKKLKERIAQGADSEDVVADFVLFNFGSVLKEHQKPYRDLDKKLKDKKGEEFLIAYEIRTEEGLLELEGERMMPSPKNFKIELYLRMGILTGNPEFKAREGELVIPTARYVESKQDYLDLGVDSAKFFNLEWKLVEGAIKEKRDNLINLVLMMEKPSSIFSLMDSHVESEFKIYVGKEVPEYFTTDGNIDDAYCKAVDLLGKH